MFEQFVEVLSSVYFIVAAMFLMLCIFAGRKESVNQHKGWKFIIAGVFITFIASSVHVSGLFHFVGFDLDIATWEFIVHGVIMPLGCLALLIGFWKWIPSIQESKASQLKLQELCLVHEESKHNLKKKYEVKAHELEDARKKLEKSEQMKRFFLSNMSHELRTPMNAIIGFSNILMETELSNDQRACITSIQSSSKNLLAMIDDVIDISQIESNDLELKKRPFNLQQATDQLYLMFKDQMEEKGLSFSVKVSPDLPEFVVGDAERLTHILSHLLSNAHKFTKKGSVEFSVSLERTAFEEVLVLFEIVDTGVGISKLELDDIFGLFMQENTSSTREFQGAGLGLALVKKLVGLMDGWCGVESEKGSGSKFWCRIPFSTSEKMAETVYTKRMSDISVLVVDDQKINLLVACDLLKKIGVGYIETAVNGQDALDKLSRCHFDMVLMDCHMPVMDGLEATTRYRHMENGQRQHLPIVALTANAMKGTKENCLDAGMDDYMAKPCDANLFKDMIRKWVLGGAQTA